MQIRNDPMGLAKRYLASSIILPLLGISIFIYLFYSETGTSPHWSQHFELYLMSMVLSSTSGYLVHALNLKLDHWISWRQMFFTRFFIGFVITLIATSGFMLLAIYLLVTFINKVELNEFFQRWREEGWKLGILILLILFIYEVFYGWFYSYRYYAIRQIDKLKSDRIQLELQFESLKSQISPHYLFNCLNTISSLLGKDVRVAEEFIRRMADTFKYVMANHQQKLVTLSEELAFVKSYYYLMQVRHQNHLKLEINIPGSLMETLVPPLAIQMLIENAVKHNDISKDAELFIYISAQDNTRIIINSTKTNSLKPKQSLHVGLNNIKDRYSFFTTEKVIVNDKDNFTVQLPVIKNLVTGKKVSEKILVPNP